MLNARDHFLPEDSGQLVFYCLTFDYETHALSASHENFLAGIIFLFGFFRGLNGILRSQEMDHKR
jgi:hypothetical protein